MNMIKGFGVISVGIGRNKIAVLGRFVFGLGGKNIKPHGGKSIKSRCVKATAIHHHVFGPTLPRRSFRQIFIAHAVGDHTRVIPIALHHFPKLLLKFAANGVIIHLRWGELPVARLGNDEHSVAVGQIVKSFARSVMRQTVKFHTGFFHQFKIFLNQPIRFK